MKEITPSMLSAVMRNLGEKSAAAREKGMTDKQKHSYYSKLRKGKKKKDPVDNAK